MNSLGLINWHQEWIVDLADLIDCMWVDTHLDYFPLEELTFEF